MKIATATYHMTTWRLKCELYDPCYLWWMSNSMYTFHSIADLQGARCTLSTESDWSATCTLAVVENASSDESPPVDISSLAITKGKMLVLRVNKYSTPAIYWKVQKQDKQGTNTFKVVNKDWFDNVKSCKCEIGWAVLLWKRCNKSLIIDFLVTSFVMKICFPNIDLKQNRVFWSPQKTLHMLIIHRCWVYKQIL